MPDETTQVADASASADAAAAQAQEQAKATQGGAAGANGAATEPDYKARVTELETTLAAATKRAETLEQTAKSAQGDQSAMRRELNQLRAEITGLRRDTEIAQAGLTSELAGDAKAAEDARKEVRERHTRTDYESNRVAVLQAFQSANVDGREWESNQEFEDSRDAWFSGNYRLGLRLAEKALDRMKAQKTAAQASPVADPVAAAKAVAAANGASPAPAAAAKPLPNMDTGRGVGAGAESLQALVNRLAKGATLTPDEHARARDAMDNKNIFPD